MATNLDADILIVGGGPAGSTAAAALRTYLPSLDVIIADRATFPRDKSCGDGLGPGVRRILTQLDALEVVHHAAVPNAVRIGGPSGAEGYAQGPTIRGRDLSGYVMRREIFDARLFDLAQARGANALQGYRAIATDVSSDHRSVTFEVTDRRTETLRARMVIAADGAYSALRKLAGVGRSQERFSHIATRVYGTFQGASVATASELSMRIDFERQLLPAYGWVFPTSSQTANIGVGVPLHIFRDRHLNIQRLLDKYVEELGTRGIKISNMRLPLGHQLPHAGGLPRLAHDRLILVGDAGSMINPLSGEGISYGMSAAEMFASILSGQMHHSFPLDAGKAWEKAIRQRFLRHWRSCWVAHKLMRSPSWADLVVRASANNRDVLDDAAEMLFDEGAMRPITGFRILRQLPA